MPPLLIAQIVARNIVPLAGILLLGWSAPNVLVLYFVDTLLSMAVIFAGLMRYMLPPPDDDWAARTNAEVGYVAAALLLVAFLAVPLGVPLIFMLAPGDSHWRTLLADPAFRGGVVMQAVAAFWSGAGLYRALRTYSPEVLRLKRRFALVFLRWMVLLMATYAGVFVLFGGYGALLFVALYVATSTVIDIAPDRFLRAMPGGAEDADSEVSPPPSSGRLPPTPLRPGPSPPNSRKHGHKRH